MTPEIREAAERALHLYRTAAPHQRERDMTKLLGVLAYYVLEQHLSDGDETVTEKWLRSIGYTCQQGDYFYREDEDQTCIRQSQNGTYCLVADRIQLHTRRQVRQLLQALGISTTESE
jgi:hypothetical protein